MKSYIRRFVLPCFAVGILFVSGVASAATMASNLPAITLTQTGGTVFTTVWDAASFTTDGASYVLNSATIHVSNETPGSLITYFADLYSDIGGDPGALLETLVPQALGNGGGFVVTDLTFASAGASLAANTTYWLVLRTDQPIGGGVAEFLGTFDGSEVSPGTWTIGNSSRRTLDAGESGFGLEFAGQIAIDASVVPEPASYALLLTGTAGILLFRQTAGRKRRPVV